MSAPPSDTLFDTHSHIDQSEFDPDRAEVLERAVSAGVRHVVAVGTTAAASRKCVQLADQFECVYAAVGIQPNYVAESEPDDWHTVVSLIDRPRVVAIGETGLDRHWDHTPFKQQQESFDRHLQLAYDHDLPFIVHMRDCETDILTVLSRAAGRGSLRGVMHSFSGTPEMAAECVTMGMYISFAGMVTYKKSDALRRCAATVPADRLLVETDSPYLSPHPVRGQRRNEPANVIHTTRCLAEVRQVSFHDLAAQTTKNAQRLFGLDHLSEV